MSATPTPTLIQQYQFISQSYLKLKTEHDKLKGLVKTYAASVNQKEKALRNELAARQKIIQDQKESSERVEQFMRSHAQRCPGFSTEINQMHEMIQNVNRAKRKINTQSPSPAKRQTTMAASPGSADTQSYQVATPPTPSQVATDSNLLKNLLASPAQVMPFPGQRRPSSTHVSISSTPPSVSLDSPMTPASVVSNPATDGGDCIDLTDTTEMTAGVPVVSQSPIPVFTTFNQTNAAAAVATSASAGMLSAASGMVSSSALPAAVNVTTSPVMPVISNAASIVHVAAPNVNVTGTATNAPLIFVPLSTNADGTPAPSGGGVFVQLVSPTTATAATSTTTTATVAHHSQNAAAVSSGCIDLTSDPESPSMTTMTTSDSVAPVNMAATTHDGLRSSAASTSNDSSLVVTSCFGQLNNPFIATGSQQQVTPTSVTMSTSLPNLVVPNITEQSGITHSQPVTAGGGGFTMQTVMTNTGRHVLALSKPNNSTTFAEKTNNTSPNVQGNLPMYSALLKQLSKEHTASTSATGSSSTILLPAESSTGTIHYRPTTSTANTNSTNKPNSTQSPNTQAKLNAYLKSLLDASAQSSDTSTSANAQSHTQEAGSNRQTMVLPVAQAADQQLIAASNLVAARSLAGTQTVLTNNSLLMTSNVAPNALNIGPNMVINNSVMQNSTQSIVQGNALTIAQNLLTQTMNGSQVDNGTGAAMPGQATSNVVGTQVTTATDKVSATTLNNPLLIQMLNDGNDIQNINDQSTTSNVVQPGNVANNLPLNVSVQGVNNEIVLQPNATQDLATNALLTAQLNTANLMTERSANNMSTISMVNTELQPQPAAVNNGGDSSSGGYVLSISDNMVGTVSSNNNVLSENLEKAVEAIERTGSRSSTSNAGMLDDRGANCASTSSAASYVSQGGKDIDNCSNVAGMENAPIKQEEVGTGSIPVKQEVVGNSEYVSLRSFNSMSDEQMLNSLDFLGS